MLFKRAVKVIFFLLIVFILYYSYYYIPSKNTGSIKIKNSELNKNLIVNKKSEIKKEEFKNTFFNTEYKNENNRGQLFTTQSKESYIFQDKPDLIHLIQPYSFTKLEKDQTLLEIKSNKGLYNKKDKLTSYENNVVIKNKNYLITSAKAEHFSSKNIIIISGNVVMKDLKNGLSHVAYCDIVEINTITNNAVAFMLDKNKRVITQKFK